MTRALNYVAMTDHTGYACVAKQYIRILRAQGVEVQLQPLVRGPGLGLWYECATPATPLDPDAPTILHCVPEYYPALRDWLKTRGVRGQVYGMTVWETDRIPAHWTALLNRMDGVIVPSAWNLRVFAESDVRVPLFVLPHASQFEGRAPVTEALDRLKARLPELRGRFVFYSIGAWSFRKGNDLLVSAFTGLKAEPGGPLLILKTSPEPVDQRPSLSMRLQRKLRGGRRPGSALPVPNDAGIVLLTEDLPEDEIAALHTVGDCYVSCARGEGWGMGLFEAAWFARPLLAPDRGGHRAYLTDGSYSGLVASRQVRVKTPGRDRSYTPDQHWDEVEVSSVQAKMREAMTRHTEKRAEAQQLKDALQQTYSAEAIGRTFLEILQRWPVSSARL